MRKKICIIGMAVLMSLVIAACGSKSSDTSDAEATSEPVEESTTEKTDKEDNATDKTDNTETASDEWTSEGAFIDDSGNHLLIYHMKVEDGYDKEGWSVTAIFGEDMYGGELELKDGGMTGKIVLYDEEGNIKDEKDATLTEGDGQVILKTGDGKEYQFTQDNTDYTEANGELLPYFQYNQVFGYDNADAVAAAAYDYLAFEKNKDYDPSHAMIPYVNIVAVDDSDANDVLIYGDYYLWEYEKDGDTLVAVAGGHCPGVIHAERNGEGEVAIYSATSMDEALTDDELDDIFGDNLKAYQKATADDKKTGEEMAQVLADYVKANDLDVTKYQLSEGETKDLPEAKN